MTAPTELDAIRAAWASVENAGAALFSNAICDPSDYSGGALVRHADLGNLIDAINWVGVVLDEVEP